MHKRGVISKKVLMMNTSVPQYSVNDDMLDLSVPAATTSTGTSSSSSSKETHCCTVCHSHAFNHLFYNGRVCHSCRAFFKRAVQDHKFINFTCSNDSNGMCNINSKSWKSCKRCRFWRCISIAGMRPSLVCPLLRNGKGRSPTDFMTTLSNSMAMSPFTMMEGEYFLDKSRRMSYHTTLEFHCMCTFDNDVLDILRVHLNSSNSKMTSHEFDRIKDFMTEMRRLTLRIDGLLVDHFNPKEVTFILDRNVPALIAFDMASWLSYEELTIDVPCSDEDKKYGQFMTRLLEQNSHLISVFNLFNSSCPGNGCFHPRPVRYNCLFSSPWLSDEQLESEHRLLSCQVKEFLCKDGGKSIFMLHGMDAIDTVIISSLVILNTCNLSLKIRERVESLQKSYEKALFRYSLFKYDDDVQMANRRFKEAKEVLEAIQKAERLLQYRLHI